MISLYFGLPGSGKTTVLTKLALEASQDITRRYKHIYHNVKSLKVAGTTYIDNECIGKYDLSDGLLLIDEAALFAGNRDYRNFGKNRLEFFVMHRHQFIDICVFLQRWDGLDLQIRAITDRVYYVYKTPISNLFGYSRYYKIPYGIIIPDPKKDKGSAKLGEIVQGYCKPSLLYRLFFTTHVKRSKYYPYFNSFEKLTKYEPLPDIYITLPQDEKVLKKQKLYRLYKKKLRKIFHPKCLRRKAKTPAAAASAAEPRTSSGSGCVGAV